MQDLREVYAGNDVADGTDVVLLMEKMWGLTTMLVSLLGCPEDVSCARSGTLERLDNQVSAADSAFKSAVLSDINSLKSSVAEIKLDLHLL